MTTVSQPLQVQLLRLCDHSRGKVIILGGSDKGASYDRVVAVAKAGGCPGGCDWPDRASYL